MFTIVLGLSMFQCREELGMAAFIALTDSADTDLKCSSGWDVLEHAHARRSSVGPGIRVDRGPLRCRSWRRVRRPGTGESDSSAYSTASRS